MEKIDLHNFVNDRKAEVDNGNPTNLASGTDGFHSSFIARNF